MSVVSGILAFVLWLSLKPETTNVTVQSSSVPKQATTLPFSDSSHNEPDTFIIEATLERPLIWSHGVRLIPDDCIQAIWLDDKQTDLTSLDAIGKCDWKKGVEIKLPGTKFKIAIVNQGGPYGLAFERSERHPLWFGVGLFAAVALLPFFFSLGMRFKLTRNAALIFSAAASIGVFVLSVVPHDTQGPVIRSNLVYINEVAYYDNLPSDGHCLTCNQPPLYYWTAGLIHRVSSKIFKTGLPEKAVQFASLVPWIFFLLVCFHILSHIRLSEKKQTWIFGVFCFIPVQYFVFLKIGPESLLALLLSGAVYYSLRYYKTRKKLDLVRAGILKLAALATHFSAFFIIPVFIVYIFWIRATKTTSSTPRSV